jgi:hypothetical protein
LVRLLALAFPPRCPSDFAAGPFPSSAPRSSSSSPVAIRITLTALPITSAGRFWPLVRLANALLAVASQHGKNVQALMDAALQRMAINYRDRSDPGDPFSN